MALMAAGPRRSFHPSEAEWLQTPVSEVMSRKVIAVTSDLRLEQLILLLIDENISGVPVVDNLGRPIGIVSKTDLVADDYDWAELREEARRLDADERFVEGLFASTTVADVMTTGALTALETLTMGNAAALMAVSHAHRLPIVDEAGGLVGIITTLDVSRWVAQRMEALLQGGSNGRSHSAGQRAERSAPARAGLEVGAE